MTIQPSTEPELQVVTSAETEQPPKPGHGDGDGGDYEPSPFVAVLSGLYKDLATAVETGSVDFGVPLTYDTDQKPNPHPFGDALWQLLFMGANPVTWAEQVTEIATAISIKLWANGLTPLPEDAAQRLLVVRAGIDLLVQDGMLIAGRKYDPFTGRPRRAAP